MAGGAATLRYRGLHLPRRPGLLDAATAQALAEGRWQPGYTAAALALARPRDRVAVVGTGCGHLVGLLAGKLGLPRLHVVEDDPRRRAQVIAIARANGLPRLAFAEAGALAALAPALLFADLATAALPPLAGLDGLRAAAFELGPRPPPGRCAALSAAAEAAGLRPDRRLSRGSAQVFLRH